MTTETSDRTPLFLMNAEQTATFVRLLAAAERGDGAAACQLGDMTREGLGGLRYSPKEAHRWYAKSALMGDAHGQCNLGACYEHGLGCAQSYTKAVKWYRLSAAQRAGTATMNLAYCLLRGVSTAQTASPAPPEERESEGENEYFSIYAESGMTPADFVEETAERYAEILVKREEGQA